MVPIAEALQLVISFAILIVMILSLVVALINLSKRK
ncbi:hypothetical protein H7198_04080 [Fructobacillus sp. CRL 2054]|nr:hypothetical protein [Fructobacillus sp. CRL 2054]